RLRFVLSLSSLLRAPPAPSTSPLSLTTLFRSQILLLRERFATSDLCAALRHARSFGAFECRAIERILCARAAPRRLAEYVQEERSEEHTSELQSRGHLVCRLLLEKKKAQTLAH